MVQATAQEKPLPPEAKPVAVAPSTLPFNGIAHIAIRVKDIAASVAFYNRLGFQQAFAMNKGDVVTQSFIKINDTQFIELYPINPGNQRTGGSRRREGSPQGRAGYGCLRKPVNCLANCYSMI